MRATWGHWRSVAARPERVRLRTAVSSPEHADELRDLGETLVPEAKRSGASFAAAALYCTLVAEPGDVVVYGADDIFVPKDWDAWVTEQFRAHDGAIIVDDGGQYGPCITQPIMTFACVLKLNRVVLHPSYHHFYADAELFANLSELKLVRDLRRSGGPVFEHRNWAWGKRPKDDYDILNCTLWGPDSENFERRMAMPLSERLTVNDPDLDRLVRASVS